MITWEKSGPGWGKKSFSMFFLRFAANARRKLELNRKRKFLCVGEFGVSSSLLVAIIRIWTVAYRLLFVFLLIGDVAAGALGAGELISNNFYQNKTVLPRKRSHVSGASLSGIKKRLFYLLTSEIQNEFLTEKRNKNYHDERCLINHNRTIKWTGFLFTRRKPLINSSAWQTAWYDLWSIIS